MRRTSLHTRYAHLRQRRLDLLANGLSPEDILEETPNLELEDIRLSLKFASQQLEPPVVAT